MMSYHQSYSLATDIIAITYAGKKTRTVTINS